jgi:hypothetical protein
VTEPGAYALRIGGLAGAEQWMQPLPAGAPTLNIEVCRSEPPSGSGRPLRVGAENVDVPLIAGARLEMRRGSDVARFFFASPPAHADLLHPYLGTAASITHAWAGREAIHGGAFLTPAGAVMMLGGREQGKSSTLAWLAAELGVEVLTDDLCVLDGESVLTGPRCIDLREPTARRYASRWESRLVRSRERFRLTLPLAVQSAPLVGIVSLRWGHRLRRVSVSPGERLAELGRQRAFGPLDADPAALLDLAALPMIAVERPAHLASLPAVCEALLAAWS